MRKRVNLFICSKPLQYFNARNIPVNNDYPNILIIEDNFIGANKLTEQISTIDKVWDKIYLVKHLYEVVKLLRHYSFENVYHYLDCFLVPAIFFNMLPMKRLYVYEEGIGTYRKTIFDGIGWYKRIIRNLMGVGSFAGSHRRCKGVYVYCPNLYQTQFKRFNQYKKNALPFKVPFSEMVIQNSELSSHLFRDEHDFSEIKNKKIGIYISSWTLNEAVISELVTNQYDEIVIKLHPHIAKTAEIKGLKQQVRIVRSAILAEFLILSLAQQNT